jgi:hypothetical protein
MVRLLILLSVFTIGILPVHSASSGESHAAQGKRHLAENWGEPAQRQPRKVIFLLFDPVHAYCF